MSIRTPALLPCLLGLTLLGGCLGRAQDLIDDANARVIITGAEIGDDLTVEVAGQRRQIHSADEQAIVVYLELEAGEHDGTVVLHADPPRCASFFLSIDDDDRADIASVDLGGAALCDEAPDAGTSDGGHDEDAGPHEDAGPTENDAGPLDDDAGPGDDAGPDAGPDEGDAGADGGPPLLELFLHLKESVSVEPCLDLLCLQVTRVDADGRVTWLDLLAAEVSGDVSQADVDAVAAATLSDDADSLFAGTDPDCVQPRPLNLAAVELERRYVPEGAEAAVVETVGVAGCAGVASELRARLSFLRQLALDL